QSLNREFQIVDRTRGRSKVKNIVDPPLNKNIIRYIVMIEGKITVSQEVCNICSISGDEVINTNNTVTFQEESVAEMRSEKPCTSGNNTNGFLHSILFYLCHNR